MNIREREPSDPKQFKGRNHKEKDADRRDRLRAVVLSIEGEDRLEGGRSTP